MAKTNHAFEKDPRGRKALPDGEKKVPVTIWVKQRNKSKAEIEAAKVDEKYK